MNEPVNLSPPPRAGGCCGMGCLTLIALLVLLALAGVGGLFWGGHHLRHNYTATEPIEMPNVITSDALAVVESTAVESSSPVSLAPVAPVRARDVEARWKAFEKASDRNPNGRIELSAGEINTLLQSHKNTRGKAFVWIENNAARVRVSLPLKNVPLMKGRYLNGEATVEASPDGDPNKARLTNIVLANNPVPDGVIDQRLFGWSSIRTMATDWLRKQNITSFKIENNRAIGEKSSTR